MPEINQLTAVKSITGADQFPVFSSGNGDARKVSANVMAEFFQSVITDSTGFITQYYAPTSSGFSVTVSPGTKGGNVHLIITPNSTLAAGTINLPDVNNAKNGQIIIVSTTNSISTVTFVSTGNQFVGIPAYLDQNSSVIFKYDKTLSYWIVISSAINNGLFVRFSDLSPPAGSSLIGYQPPGTGASATTVELALKRWFVDAGSFISTTKTAAQNNSGWAALLVYAATIPGGCHVLVSPGTYLFSAATPMRIGMRLTGASFPGTVFSYSHTGDGLTMTSPVNSSTGVFSIAENIKLVNTSGANTGGAYVDLGGSEFFLENIYTSGWNYSLILDQSEIATIQGCHFESSGSAAVWITNGPDRTPGALTQFTNRITIRDCQINIAPVGIMDDGGVAHHFYDNNYNAVGTAIRAAGCADLVIDGANEFEGIATCTLDFYKTTFHSAQNVGPCNVKLSGSSLQASATACVRFNSGAGPGHYFHSDGNSYVTNPTAIIGAANCASLKLSNDLISVGAAYTDADGTSAPDYTHLSYPVHQIRQQVGTGATIGGLQLYIPSSAGGSSLASRIDFCANNGNNNKIIYAFISQANSDNAAGSEDGLLFTYVKINGVDTRISRLDNTGFRIQRIGSGFSAAEGSNAKQGVATLVAGSAVVANTSVTSTSRIFLTSQVDGGTPGFVRVSTRSVGTSFTITSSNAADTSTIAYEIFEVG